MNERFGFKIVRGSTTRGAPTAMLRMIRDARAGTPA